MAVIRKAKRSLSYKDTGVDYDLMDPLKQKAQLAGLKTVENLKGTGVREVGLSRGESAYVMDMGDFYLATIEECLGTKALVADAMREITGKTYYDKIAQDTIAMMVNDIATVGARPLTVLAYWAAGNSEWFEDKQKISDLVKGWKKACDLSGATWGGGETPTLKGVVEKGAVDLAGACVGMIKPKSRFTLGKKLKVGNAIVLLASSGIHANGLSLARRIADDLPGGYKTKISNGKMYGEALLVPTTIYSGVVQDLFKARVDIHYLANITGHGWRKIMRHRDDFTYRINKLLPVPPVLAFMQEKGPVSDEEAYGSLNMGAGYAVFVPESDVEKVIGVAKKNKIRAYHAGMVERGEKRVIIEPLDIVFEGESLKVRA